jgi:hypothetical protein
LIVFQHHLSYVVGHHGGLHVGASKFLDSGH